MPNGGTIETEPQLEKLLSKEDRRATEMAIELNEQTERALEIAARQSGVSVDEFIRQRVLATTPSAFGNDQSDTDALIAELDRLAFSGPVIDDSREAIYEDD